MGSDPESPRRAQPPGSLGQEFAEANESDDKKAVVQTAVTDADKRAVVGGDGIITMPAAAFVKPAGKYSVMQGFPGGMQLHAFGGFSAGYQPAVPYTLGMWQNTQPVELSLAKGRNIIQSGLKEGSRGVTVKDLSLKAVN